MYFVCMKWLWAFWLLGSEARRLAQTGAAGFAGREGGPGWESTVSRVWGAGVRLCRGVDAARYKLWYSLKCNVSDMLADRMSDAAAILSLCDMAAHLCMTGMPPVT